MSIEYPGSRLLIRDVTPVYLWLVANDVLESAVSIRPQSAIKVLKPSSWWVLGMQCDSIKLRWAIKVRA